MHIWQKREEEKIMVMVFFIGWILDKFYIIYFCLIYIFIITCYFYN